MVYEKIKEWCDMCDRSKTGALGENDGTENDGGVIARESGGT